MMVAVKNVPVRLWASTLMCCCTLLSGCQSSQEPDNALYLQLTADDDANPDLTLRPSPTLVWVMQLADDEDFNHADFFSLVERPFPRMVHGLLSRRSLMLRPGEVRELKLVLRSGAQHIALVAEFRDLTGSVWRRSIPLGDRVPELLSVRIMRQAIMVTSTGDAQEIQHEVRAKHDE
jgi:type VI secretion system VasD/TssJ family lipoprotein